ncbi:MAG: hypothetical protein LBL13_05090 [Bacteroidales bacterium]|jgi:hypothetical protein|nr:hypothetical protein [Bacteroidales bacterium]
MTADKHITVCFLEDAAHSVELSGYMEENGISDVSDFLTGTEADRLQIDGNIILPAWKCPQMTLIIRINTPYFFQLCKKNISIILFLFSTNNSTEVEEKSNRQEKNDLSRIFFILLHIVLQ